MPRNAPSNQVEVSTQQEVTAFVTAPFQIRHPNGTVLFSLELGKSGPVLRLFDYEGRPAFELCADREMGTALFVQGEAGQDLVSLTDAGEGAGGAVVVHATDPEDEITNRARVELHAGKHAGELVLRHKDAPSVCLGCTEHGSLITRKADQ